jgi:hypothetical protein
MAEPWLAGTGLKGSEDRDKSGNDENEDGLVVGRGFSITSPKGAKASRVRGMASITIGGPENCSMIGDDILFQ